MTQSPKDVPNRPRIGAVGEIVWDLFPDAPRLGGSPANVAFHAAQLGADGVLLSAVGADALGERALTLLQAGGVDVRHIQRTKEAPTGRVSVHFKSDGQPSFTIEGPSAWDHLRLGPPDILLLQTLDVLCLSTLAQRSAAARRRTFDALRQLRSRGPAPPLFQESHLRRGRPWILVDLNLRAPFDDPTTVFETVAFADVIKVSEEELAWVARQANTPRPEDFLFELSGAKLLAITCGARGATLITRSTSVSHAGFPLGGSAQVNQASPNANPVGAGDSFVAALALGLSQGNSPAACLEAAHRTAAWVAGQPGAMPISKQSDASNRQLEQNRNGPAPSEEQG